MGQLFSPLESALFRYVLVAIGLLLLVAMIVGDLMQGSSYVDGVDTDVSQPVPFSHEHHVGALGIDCRFCHTTVDKGPSAGMPSTEICMKCHREIWKDSPMLAPVRESYRTGKPLSWNRVYDLPGFVYFDHSIHVRKGISCQTCHGRIDQMPLVAKEHSLYMQWCLDCHHHPGNYILPHYEVFKMGDKSLRHPDIHSGYYSKMRIKQITNCSTCHH